MCEEYSFPRKRKIVHSHKTSSRIWRLSQTRLTLQEICLPLRWLEEDYWYWLQEEWCVIYKEVRRKIETVREGCEVFAGLLYRHKASVLADRDASHQSFSLDSLWHGQTILSRRYFSILSALANSNVLPSDKGVCMTTDHVTLRKGVGQSSII